MRPNSRWTSLAALAAGVAVIATACSASAASPTTAVLGTTSGPTTAGPAGATSMTLGSATSSTLGAYLTGQNGMTLYVLTNDTPDNSTCSGSCATNWPPLTVAAGATLTGPSSAMSAFGQAARSDGTVQVTYNHMPLYYYAGDSAAGDTNGQGKNNTWFVAPVSGSLTTAPTAPAAPKATDTAASMPPSGY
jgi:predicted lipoprotein with Yx(FWY)xxD motif